MRRFTGTLLNATGVTLPFSTVKVVIKDTLTPVTIYNSALQATANPITTDASGQFSFYVASGSYDFLDGSNNKLYADVQIYDLTNPLEWLDASKVGVTGLASFANVQSWISYIHGLLNPSVLPSVTAIPAGSSKAGENTLLPYNVRLRVTSAVAVGLGAVLTGNTPLFVLPARSVITGVLVEVVTPFAHPTAASIVAGLMPPGGTTGQYGQKDVKVAGQASQVNYVNPSSTLAASNVNVSFVIPTGTLSQMTAGTVDFTVSILQLP